MLMLATLAATPLHAQSSRQKQGVTISVRVTDQNGEQVWQVQLELVRFPTGLAETIFTDSNGRAEFHPVAPDQYIIRASKAGYEPAQISINAMPGQSRYELSIELQLIEVNPNKPGGMISARELSIP
jgi:protocatechuate 3,4-dioxygenase beta subunit